MSNAMTECQEYLNNKRIWYYRYDETSLFLGIHTRVCKFDIAILTAHPEWVQIAINPFVKRPTCPENMTRLYHEALRESNDIFMVKLTVDKDGDLALLAEIPAKELTENLFNITITRIIKYAEQLYIKFLNLAHTPYAPGIYDHELEGPTDDIIFGNTRIVISGDGGGLPVIDLLDEDEDENEDGQSPS